MAEKSLSKQSVKLPFIAQHEPCVATVLGHNPGPFTLQGTNTYLIGTGKSRILLDTGEGKVEYLDSLRKAMKDYGVESIQEVVLTHHHHDHIGGVPQVVDAFGPLKISKMKLQTELEESKEVHRGALDELESKYNVENIVDGQEFRTEGASIKAIYTPGHTDDHMAFVLTCDESDNSKNGAVFSGDHVLGEGTAVFRDLYKYMNSLERLLKLGTMPRIYPAHGPIIENPVERITAYIQHRQMRDKQILATLTSEARPMTSMQIVEIVYKDTPKFLHPAANNNLQLHLHKLQKEGKVQSDDDKYWRIVSNL